MNLLLKKLNNTDQQKKIQLLPGDLCDCGVALFISSVILNPLVWPIAIYYSYNFYKLTKIDNAKDKEEFEKCKKKSAQLLIISSLLIIPCNIAANMAFTYYISYNFIKADKAVSLCAALAVTMVLCILSVGKASTEAMQKNSNNKCRLFCLQTAAVSNGFFFLPSLILGWVPIRLSRAGEESQQSWYKDQDGNLCIDITQYSILYYKELQVNDGMLTVDINEKKSQIKLEKISRNGREYYRFNKQEWELLTFICNQDLDWRPKKSLQNLSVQPLNDDRKNSI